MASPSAVPPIEIGCQGILFDMDGILISSIEAAERAWLRWAAMRSVDPGLTVRTLHGRRTVETVSILRPDLDAEAELKIVEELECSDTGGLKVLPGVPELLRSLSADRWTVVTSATARLARVRLSAAGLPVPERLVTAERVSNGKPHPEPFLAGAALLGFPAQACVVFEDSLSGAQAGRAAGCTVVATTFSHGIESLDAAHYVVPDVTGVRVSEGAEGLVLRLGELAS